MELHNTLKQPLQRGMYLRSTISDVASAYSMQVWRTRTDKRKLSSLDSHLVTQQKQCPYPALKDLSFMSTTVTSLVPRRGGGGGETAWYTLYAHALNRHGIPWRPCSYVYTLDVINSLLCCVSWCYVRVSFVSHCSWPSGS